MKVLVVGGGGREHALCWKLRQSPLLKELYCAPGNPGIASLASLVPLQPEEVDAIADFAADRRIDLTIVGPEVPLILGLVDKLSQRGLAAFGPTRAAAELEGSKVFAKWFMARHSIPTARFAIAESAEEARQAVAEIGFPVVLKADGLAAGKGVVLPKGLDDLEVALSFFFHERRFGSSARRVVVEEFLEGEEVSFMALSDGERLLPLATARDHKRVGEGDTGPNTGGMGAHSPSFSIAAETASEIVDQILRPTLRALAEEGRPFRGVLYAGLMLTSQGPKVLEFNARLGDPEAQVVLLRLEEDLLPVLAEGAVGRFDRATLTFRQEVATCVVLASPGYPDQPRTGEQILGLETAAALPGVQIFHAGTARRDNYLVSGGGRVLSVCGLGASLPESLERAYSAVRKIDWPNKVFRADIGHHALGKSVILES